jgi:hypothetical protein
MFPFGIVPKDPEAYRIGAWTFGVAPRVPLTDIFPGIETTSVIVHRSYDRTRDLSLDAQEVLAVCAVASHLGARSMIEVGTADGNTTMNLIANGGLGARIVTIDLPEDWRGDFEFKVPEMMKNVTSRSSIGIQYRQHANLDGKVRQVYSDSAAVDFEALGGPFDLAFIDGCHFYEYVKKDTENCFRHMEPGGAIIWHDYGMIRDVSVAVDEWANQSGIPVAVVAGTRLAIARMPT